ncbi:MAG TPA: HD domain-containing protein [Thermoanaerobaculia bacterium]|nr:HD domain-containing protein [Thermoanaerobaculia bacterium]HUM29067.1 HD domain-containing protein [Thermoanaerobaculia bacterium]HXK67377.1 HD domain-containing protein [Thermoanaerobaculia bacterium]
MLRAHRFRSISSLQIVLLTGAIYAILNQFGSVTEIFPGVSIVFPATAIAVASIYHFGFPAVLGIFLGTMITPWGAKEGLLSIFIYYLPMGVINVLEGLIPALAFRKIRTFDPELSRLRDIGIFLLFACILNTGISSVSGNLIRHLVSGAPFSFAPIKIWWIADGIAALVWGLPLFLLLEFLRKGKSPFVLGKEGWEKQEARVLPDIFALIILFAGVFYLTESWGIGSFHIFAILFLIPLLWATWTQGLPGGTIINGVISIAYITVALITDISAEGAFPRFGFYANTVTVYLFLYFFALFAIFGGHLADQKRELLREIERRRKDIEQDFLSAVCALSAAIEAKDPGTVDHVRRVSDHSVMIGRILGLEGEDLHTLQYAAILHDVGKIGIPESILLKPGPLTEEEKAVMKRHVEVGARIIGNVSALQGAVPLILHHQERWDGDVNHPRFPAYPEGLQGEDIPLGSRIIAVIDAFDAMTSERPYRSARSREEAVRELKEEAGRQFDPGVVEAFISAFSDFGELQAG